MNPNLKALWLGAKRNKGKIALAFWSALLFFVLLFPLSDLSNWVTSQVSKATANQVFLQFREVGVALIPAPGIRLEKVTVDAAALGSSLAMQELVLSPSIKSFFSKTPMGSVHAEGLFQGQANVALKSGSKSETGVERKRLELQAEAIRLKDLLSFLGTGMQLRGLANVQADGLVDLQFQEQPDMNIKASIDKLEVPPSSIETPMGPLALPELRVSALQARAKLQSGRLLIEELRLGAGKDELTGLIKGYINVQLQASRGQAGLVPIFGAYSFDVDLSLSSAASQRLGFFLTFIDRYKIASPQGDRYRFTVAASSLGAPAKITDR